MITWVDWKLVMCLIWRVIDCVSWSKTRHVFDMASFWLRELIKNSSCAWYGKLLIAWVDLKLVMCLIWQVFDYVSWSKTRHVLFSQLLFHINIKMTHRSYKFILEYFIWASVCVQMCALCYPCMCKRTKIFLWVHFM